jgi:class 3 adenylate cyclase
VLGSITAARARADADASYVLRAHAREVVVERMRTRLHIPLLVVAALLWAGGAAVLARVVVGAHGEALDVDRTIVAVGLLAGAWILASAAALVPRGAVAAAVTAPPPPRAPAPAATPAAGTRSVPDEDEDDAPGPRAELTVLFCSIRGVTSWAEDRSASDVIADLNALLAELSASIATTSGTLDMSTSAGAGLVAFWGAPVAVDDHAVNAARAALDMLERLDRINDRRRSERQAPFEIGVGVHSGTVIGDTVSAAARLEASTSDREEVLLVSRATVDLLDDGLRARASHVDHEDAWTIRAEVLA